jgi:hypothetical protein
MIPTPGQGDGAEPNARLTVPSSSSGSSLSEQSGIFQVTAKLWNRASSSPYLSAWTLIGLLVADALLIAAFFRPFLPGPGALVYGDLQAYYTYSGIQAHWVLTSSIYQVADQALSLAVHWPVAQNSLYIATFFLPSIGVYLFLAPFSPFKPLAGAVAFSAGTIVNPIFVSNFIEGGPEYGLWLLFSFLGFGFVCAFLIRESPRWWIPVVAGICFGLASTQTYGVSAMDVGGVLLTGVPLLGLLLYGILRNWNRPSRQRTLLGIGIFLAVYALLLTPVVVSGLSQSSTVFASQSDLQSLTSGVVANIRYTFRPYGFPAAFLDIPPTVTTSGFRAVLSPAWVAVVVLSLFGAAVTFVRGRGPWKWMNGIFLCSYLGYAGVLLGLSSGALLALYVSFPLVDLLDGPDLFVYAQLVCVPFMFLSFLRLVAGKDFLLPASSKDAPSIAAAVPRKLGQAGTTGLPRWSARRLSGMTATGLVAAVLVVSMIATGVPADLDLESSVSHFPGVYPTSPFAPSEIFSVRQWYESADPALTGYILPLPADYLSVNALVGVVPAADLWVIPLHTASIVSGFNSSTYVEIMQYLASGSINAWAEQIGLAGVEYVALEDTSSNITLTPSYLQTSPAIVPYAVLSEELDRSPELLRTYASGGVEVFLDRAYLGPGATTGGLSLSGLSPPPTRSPTIPALPMTGFSGWNYWPSWEVTTFSNGSASIHVNTSASPAYSVLWAPLTLYPAWTGKNSSNSERANLDPLYSSVDYTFMDHIDVPSGVTLQMYVAWYNVTDSQSLYRWFTFTNIAQYNSTDLNVSSNFTAPAGALSARVIYYAFPDTGSVSADVYVTAPSALRSVSTPDLTNNSAAQFEVASSLEADSVIPNPSMIVGPPLAQEFTPSIPPGAFVTSISPAGDFDPDGDSQFSIPLNSSGFPALGFGGQVASLALLLMGSSRDPNGSDTINVSLEGKSIVEAVQAPNFSVAFNLAVPSQGETAVVNLTGNLTLSLIALTLKTEVDPTTGQSTFSVPLPLGRVTGSVGGSDVTIQKRVSPKLGSSPDVTESDFIPLPALAILIGAVFVLHRRRQGFGLDSV